MKYFKKILIEDVESLMAANFLVESYQDILFDILTMPNININDDYFNRYVNDYTDKYVYFEMLKRKISDIYISADIHSKCTTEWSIDFDTKIMTLDVMSTLDDDSFILKEGWERLD